MKPNQLKQIGTVTMALMLMFSFASNIGHAAQMLKAKSQTLKAKPQVLKTKSTPRSFKGKIGTVPGTPFINSTVYVEVYKLKVHGDGDKASPGDWVVAFGAGRAADVNTGGAAPKWPSSGTKNIRSGHTYFPRGLKRKILNVKPNETIKATLGVMDCDSPALLLALATVYTYPIFSALDPNICVFGAEEVYNITFDNDVLVGNTNIYPNQWGKGVHLARRFRMNGLDVTAYFHAGTNPHARSGGGTPIKPGDQDRGPIHRN